MVETPKSATADVIEVFEIGFADFSNEEALETGEALAIIGAHLSQEPMGFPAATSAAVTDEGGTVEMVTEADGSAGFELTGMEADPGAGEVEELIAGTAEALAKGSVGKNPRGNGATHRLASARSGRGFVAEDGGIGAEFVGHGRTIARIFSDHWEAPKTIRKHTQRNEKKRRVAHDFFERSC